MIRTCRFLKSSTQYDDASMSSAISAAFLPGGASDLFRYHGDTRSKRIGFNIEEMTTLWGFIDSSEGPPVQVAMHFGNGGK